MFTECRFRPVTFVEVDFTLAVLGGSDLRGVDLTGCRLAETGLVEADLRKAALRGADLRGARTQSLRCEEADLGIGRDKPREAGRRRHQADGDDERGAPSMLVAIAAEHHGPERPEQEADAEGDESVDERERLIAGRKEGLADRHGKEAVENEVEELEEIADRAGDDGAATDGTGMGDVGTWQGCR